MLKLKSHSEKGLRIDRLTDKTIYKFTFDRWTCLKLQFWSIRALNEILSFTTILLSFFHYPVCIISIFSRFPILWEGADSNSKGSDHHRPKPIKEKLELKIIRNKNSIYTQPDFRWENILTIFERYQLYQVWSVQYDTSLFMPRKLEKLCDCKLYVI